jgi:hypothetical protein
MSLTKALGAFVADLSPNRLPGDAVITDRNEDSDGTALAGVPAARA